MATKSTEFGMVVTTTQHPHQRKRWKIWGKLSGTPVMYCVQPEQYTDFKGSRIINLVASMIIFPKYVAAKNKALELLRSDNPTKRALGIKLLKAIKK